MNNFYILFIGISYSMSNFGTYVTFLTLRKPIKNNNLFDEIYIYQILNKNNINIRAIESFKKILSKKVFNKQDDFFEVYIMFDFEIEYFEKIDFQILESNVIEFADADVEIEEIKDLLQGEISSFERDRTEKCLSIINKIKEIENSLSEYFKDKIYVNTIHFEESITDKIKLNIGIPIGKYQEKFVIQRNAIDNLNVIKYEFDLTTFWFKVYNPCRDRFKEVLVSKKDIELNNESSLLAAFSKFI